MILRKNGFALNIKIYYGKNEIWIPIPEECYTEAGCDFRTAQFRYQAFFEQKGEEETAFSMVFEASYDTRMKMEVTLSGEEDYYHVIPCNIYGDNHAEEVRIGEFPLLTKAHPEAAFCSPYWEFRADRAAMPLSALCCKRGTAAVSVDPYSEEEGREDGSYLKNGLFAALPDSFGVTLGYTNEPVTFLNRSVPAAAAGSRGRKASATGRIYVLAGRGRTDIHEIVRREYEKRHVRPSFGKTFRQAAEAMLDAFCCLNYDKASGEYTNRKCRPFQDRELKPWRNVVEIGWTGGAILAYPLVESRYLLGGPAQASPGDVKLEQTRLEENQALEAEGNPAQASSGDVKLVRTQLEENQALGTEEKLAQVSVGDVKPERTRLEENQALGTEEKLSQALSGEEMIDRIVAGYREESGFFLDLYAPVGEGPSGRLNGWWTYYGLCRDCHCAYTQGSAVYYILKTILFLKKKGVPYREAWLEGCRKVLDTAVYLQREDGAFGYTYSASEKKVLDWEGFAGCWFVPGLLYLARLTGESSYAEAARKAHGYYRNFVHDLDCCGAPMDTWKAVDQEGNLSFLHGSRLLYEDTGEARFLEDMKCSAGYEFLWRYGYPTRPEHPPVKDGWNACGGSVTSVSNPHIHPMGVLADEDLLFLADAAGDAYYRERALDSAAWMMQTLELYPDKTGYGRYGILSERWCPSDGLVTERYDNGQPYGSWFSYNLWAAANVFEAVLSHLDT